MNYARIENGAVANIIWLNAGNAGDFPNAIPCGDRPVRIGDTYADDTFTRDGSPVLTPLEEALRAADEVMDLIEGGIVDVDA